MFILTAIGHIILKYLSAKNVDAANKDAATDAATEAATDAANKEAATDVANKEAATNAAIDAKLVYWKERTEFIFNICMSILLIYYFKPGKPKLITKETSLLFYLFGWIIIITAKWGTFITDAKWYKSISSS